MSTQKPAFVLASHTLGSTNPYLSQLEEALCTQGVTTLPMTLSSLLRRRPLAWHMHWPDALANRRSMAAALRGFAALAVGLGLARLRSVPVVWTVHNAKSHDVAYAWVDRLVRWLLARSISGWIALSPTGVAEAVSSMPPLRDRPHHVIPHGHYRSVYPFPLSKVDAREKLGLDQDATVLLFFGLIRPYKNVPALIRAFSDVAGPEFRLVVAGRLVDGADEELRRYAAKDVRVALRLEHVPDEDVPDIFASSDLVVLPFQEISNSGSAILALSFDRPVLVPRKGAMPWLQEQVGSDWVNLYDELSPECLLAAMERARQLESVAALDALSWDGIGEQTATFFRSLRS